MILVRMVFQTEWGKAQQVVDGFKQNVEMMRRIVGPNVRARILTDLSGPFHTVIQEMEVESLAEWERIRAAMFANSEFQQAQANSSSPFVSGRTEFYTIEVNLEA
jgi:predicted transcriptional regulator